MCFSGLEELRKSPGGFVIKIDITLAIPFKLKDESHRIWPLEGVGDDVQLNMNMVILYHRLAIDFTCYATSALVKHTIVCARH